MKGGAKGMSGSYLPVQAEDRLSARGSIEIGPGSPLPSLAHGARHGAHYSVAMLNDTRILDLTDEPLALGARLLADLGADVIRVEDARGDHLRMREPAMAGDAPRAERAGPICSTTPASDQSP